MRYRSDAKVCYLDLEKMVDHNTGRLIQAVQGPKGGAYRSSMLRKGFW